MPVTGRCFCGRGRGECSNVESSETRNQQSSPNHRRTLLIQYRTNELQFADFFNRQTGTLGDRFSIDPLLF